MLLGIHWCESLAVTELCLALTQLYLRTGSPVLECLPNTMGSSWSTGSTATQFWICWGRSGPSSGSGRGLISPRRLSGCCCKNGMWVDLDRIWHLWNRILLLGMVSIFLCLLPCPVMFNIQYMHYWVTQTRGWFEGSATGWFTHYEW